MNRRNFLKALSGAVFIAVAPRVLADEKPNINLISGDLPSPTRNTFRVNNASIKVGDSYLLPPYHINCRCVYYTPDGFGGFKGSEPPKITDITGGIISDGIGETINISAGTGALA